MLFKRVIAATLLVILPTGCSINMGANIDAEPAIALLGGMMMSIRDDGTIAKNELAPVKKLDLFFDALNPIKEAFATPTACPLVSEGYCDESGPDITRDGDDTTLAVYYGNCQASGLERPGYWHSLVTYKFPDNATCEAVRAGGFTSGVISSDLVGKTIYKRWGLSQAGNQDNIRVGANEEVAYFYSDFPSGWKGDEQGGLSIEFVDATTRNVEILGVHALGISHNSAPVEDPDSFDLRTMSSDLSDPNLSKQWDHTINTVASGDLLFQIGPDLTMSGGRPVFGGLGNNTRANFDGTIVVSGNTIARGATIRVQHNISESLGVLVVSEPLVYSDPTCCWPMSGKVIGQYDRNFRAPTLDETVEFTGASCGAIKYSNIVLSEVDKTLSHCF